MTEAIVRQFYSRLFPATQIASQGAIPTLPQYYQRRTTQQISVMASRHFRALFQPQSQNFTEGITRRARLVSLSISGD